jgi:hypothetical protein
MFYEYVSKNTIDSKGKKIPWIIFKSPDSKVELTRRQNQEVPHGFGKDV